FFFFSSRRRHTRFSRDWSSDVCSSDLVSKKRVMAAAAASARASSAGSCTRTSVPKDVNRSVRNSSSGEAPHAHSRKTAAQAASRSEERRVGKECRSGWARERNKKRTEI